MDPRRLELLLELSRLGSMGAVAEAMRTTTSTVSQQLAVLSREAGVALLEPDGRRVRLTPAGRRLAGHAINVLSALEQARLDLDPEAEPRGTLRVASFATGVRRSLLPVIRTLAVDHPQVRLVVHEHEPGEAIALVEADEMDLALIYDYDLAAAAYDPALQVHPLWSASWHLGVPAHEREIIQGSAQVFARFSDADWIVNSRNTADEDAVRTLAGTAGFSPRIAHRADSLELVNDLISAGLGVGLLPDGWSGDPGVRLLPLRDPGVSLRAFTVLRRGRENWPPLALVHRLLTGS